MSLDHLHEERILILDYGSQYTQLIARRVRESQVYCEIHPFDMPLEAVRAFRPKGIILSGSPASVHDPGGTHFRSRGLLPGRAGSRDLLRDAVDGPSIGRFGGKGVSAGIRAGPLSTSINRPSCSGDIEREAVRVWMSHGDRILALPFGFIVLAHSQNSPVAAMGDASRRLYAVQFHPEVVHTPCGKAILENFLFLVCGCLPTWTMKSFVKTTVSALRERVGSDQVICALSGGVDSSVSCGPPQPGDRIEAALHLCE